MLTWENQVYYTDTIADKNTIEYFIDLIIAQRAVVGWDVKHSRLNIVQVGVGTGKDTKHLLELNDNIEVIGYEHRPSPEGQSIASELSSLESKFTNRFTLIRHYFGNYSWDNYAWEKLEERIDMIIINAEAVKEHVENYLYRILSALSYYRLAPWCLIVIYRANMDDVQAAINTVQTSKYFLRVQSPKIIPHSPKLWYLTPRFPASGEVKDFATKESV